MNRTKIEWVKNPDGTQGYTWNPITGCLNHVNGLCRGGGFPCYAYKLANGRLKVRYLANKNTATDRYDEDSYPFYPRFWESRLNEGIFDLGRKPKGIFVCDMSDLFCIGIPEMWTRKVLAVCNVYPQHRFYLLTKQPQNLINFSPFPENAWVGVTATNEKMFYSGIESLKSIEATVRFISVEPLLSWNTPFDYLVWESLWRAHINLLILGACTGTVKEISHLVDKYPQLTPMQSQGKWTAQPKIEWIKEIVEAADRAMIPVFLKDNLRPLLVPEDCRKPNYLMEDIFWASEKAELRQELPT